ncbi:MAG: tetratricopeptide repeat protein [Chlamydiae bacterium]|nr:tetratricopeptide repeat protein [Chlamydiota bacterium]MBI3266542.1 tetratricopeptide repeat protein [Chlamydiota bacterium]
MKLSLKTVLIFFLFLPSLFSQTASDQALEKAEAAYLSGDFLEAVRLYNVFLEQFPSASSGWEVSYWKGCALMTLEKYNEARVVFEAVKEKSSDLALQEEAALGIADSLCYVGEKESALSQYEDLWASGHSANGSYLLYQIGMIWKEKGDTEKARRYFQQILSRFPESYEALKVKGERLSLSKTRGYFIQMGIFHVKVNAERLVTKIKNLRYPYQLEEIHFQGAKAYRLKVGAFSKRVEARKALFQIEQVTHVKGHVVEE